MTITFRDFLIAEADEHWKIDLSMYDFRRLLSLFSVAAQPTNKASTEDPVGDRNIIRVLEMIDIIDLFKEHLIEWLHKFDWKKGHEMFTGDKKEGHIDFWNYIESEFEHILESYYKKTHPTSGMSTVNKMAMIFNNIVIKPIVQHYKQIGDPHAVLQSIDINDFSSKADDIFGDLIRTIERLEVTGHQDEDVVSARKALAKYDVQTKAKLKSTRKSSKRQRMAMIHQAVQNVQGRKEEGPIGP